MPTLKAALADEPALFAELIRWQFRSENDSGLDVTYTPDDKHLPVLHATCWRIFYRGAWM